MKCSKCGAEIMEGVSFCVHCGSKVGSNQETSQIPRETPQANVGNLQSIQPKDSPAKGTGKNNAPLIAIAVILTIFVIMGIVLVVINVVNTDEPKATPSLDSGNSRETIETVETNRVTNEGSSRRGEKGDVTLLEPAKQILQQASEEYQAGQYDGGAINHSTEAINTLLAVAESNNLQAEANDSIAEAYQLLKNSVMNYGDVLLQQGVANSSCAEQTYNCIQSAFAVGDEIVAKGYTVDATDLQNYLYNYIQTYRDLYIAAINDITRRENWSRDEAWNYAEQAASLKADGKAILFDETNLEDPLRMRYAYCLAWITRKRCETGLADGSMTNEMAMQTMIAVLKETDYNILLLQDIVGYGNVAGIDASIYNSAYNAIVDEIRAEQNLSVGADIGVTSSTYVDAAHFWYFNDLDGEDKYKVDIYNGTTAATRQWIRTNVPVILGE